MKQKEINKDICDDHKLKLFGDYGLYKNITVL